MTKTTLTTLLSLTVFAACQLVSAAEIQLRSACQTPGGLLLLGSVAEIHATTSGESEELANIELLPAPAPGTSRVVRLREIQDLMVLRGQSLVKHRFSGANQVTVTTETPGAPATYASSRQPSGRPVSVGKQPQRESVRRAVYQPAAGDWPNQVPAAEARPMVVAVRAVPRGATIGQTDVQLRYDAVPGRASQPLGRLEEVVGQEAHRTIAAGAVVDRQDVRTPLLVRRGEVVTVFATSSGVRVRTQARARDDGSQGDLVSVESLSDRQAYFARVSGVQQVHVDARAAHATQQPKNVQLPREGVRR